MIFVALSSFFHYSCIKAGRNSKDQNNEIPSKEDSVKINHENDSIEKVRVNNMIPLVERDFLASLKSVDRDYGENNTSKFKKILKKNNTTVYELYTELVDIFKKSKEEAIQKATNSGLQERKYVDFIDQIEKKYVNEFQAKYDMDDRLYVCFINNYCSCQGYNAEIYCNGEKCELPNGEYFR